MMVTNVNLSKKAQELLIKAAAERKVSVESLASEILNESIENKFSQINTNISVGKKYSPNPLANMQPYAYYADPEESAIPLEDWDMEKYDEEIG
jgi:hypothetical protein